MRIIFVLMKYVFFDPGQKLRIDAEKKMNVDFILIFEYKRYTYGINLIFSEYPLHSQ